MPSIAIDTSRPSLVVIRFDGVVDDEAFDRYLKDIHEIGQRRGRADFYALIIDGRGGGRPTPAQRHRQTEFIKLHHEVLTARCVGAAFVITSAVARGVLTALLWVQPLPYEHVVVGSVDDAENWCGHRLAARAASGTTDVADVI